MPFLSLSSAPLNAELLGAVLGDAPVPVSAKVSPGCRARPYSARSQLLPGVLAARAGMCQALPPRRWKAKN